MKKIAFITDSFFALDEDSSKDIFSVSLRITEKKDSKMADYPDNDQLKIEEIFKRMSEGYTYTTSLPLMSDMMSRLEFTLSNYENVIIIPICKSISGTYDLWNTVVKEFTIEEQKRIHLLDTTFTTEALADKIEESIQRYSKELNPIQHITKFLKEEENKEFSGFVINDLTPLVKSGRISKLKGMIVSTLNKKVGIIWEGKMARGPISSSYEKITHKLLDKASNKLNLQRQKIQRFGISIAGNQKSEIFRNFRLNIENWFTNNGIDIPKIEIFKYPSSIAIHTGENSLVMYVKIN